MSSPPSPIPVLPPSWTQVVDQLQEAIQQALAAHPEPEPVLATPDRDWQDRRRETWQRLQQRQEAFTGRLARLEQEATAADDELAAVLAALARWSAALVEIQGSLADRAGRTV
jgi:flagellar biosynthesis chaperone FliJ